MEKDTRVRYCKDFDEAQVVVIEGTTIIATCTGEDRHWHARELACGLELVMLAERVAEHFADTDAPLGIDARRILEKVRGHK